MRERPGIDEWLALDALCLTSAGGGPLDLEVHRQRLTDTLEKASFTLVRRAGVLVAYGYLWPMSSGSWFVGGLAIHPAHRNASVTGELSGSLLAHLAELGAAELHSHVLKTNAASLRLHRRLGFAPVKDNEIAVAMVARVDAMTLPSRRNQR